MLGLKACALLNFPILKQDLILVQVTLQLSLPSAEITGLGHHPQLNLKLFNSSANKNLKYLKPFVKGEANT